jgi:hypothetical protein
MEEYLRRNQLHAASGGIVGVARAALTRARSLARCPCWLADSLECIIEQGSRVEREMAAHRDEKLPERDAALRTAGRMEET